MLFQPYEGDYSRFHKVSFGSINGPIERLPEFAQKIFDAIRDTRDVCARFCDLDSLLHDTSLYPYASSNLDRYRRVKPRNDRERDIKKGNFLLNRPLFKINPPRFLNYTGYREFDRDKWRECQATKKTDGDSSTLSALTHDSLTKHAWCTKSEWVHVTDTIGRKDLMKKLLTAEGFDEEFAKRLGIEILEVRRVIELAVQAITVAESNEDETIKHALSLLINALDDKKPSLKQLNTYSNVWETQQYLILEWLRNLSDKQARTEAAKLVVERMRELADGDDNRVARALVKYSSTLYYTDYDELRLGRDFDVIVIDFYEDFPEGNDLLWSALLGKEVVNAKAILEECGKDGDLQELKIQDLDSVAIASEDGVEKNN